MKASERLLLALRVTMEVGVVAGAAACGVHLGGGTASKVALGVLAPAVAFGVWGAVDFRQAGQYAEALRLVEELAITTAVGIGWYWAGRPILGSLLIALSVAYHSLVYAFGDRLLKDREPVRRQRSPLAQ